MQPFNEDDVMILISPLESDWDLTKSCSLLVASDDFITASESDWDLLCMGFGLMTMTLLFSAYLGLALASDARVRFFDTTLWGRENESLFKENISINPEKLVFNLVFSMNNSMYLIESEFSIEAIVSP